MPIPAGIGVAQWRLGWSMKRKRFRLVVITAFFLSFVVIRCGGSHSGGGAQVLSPNGNWNQVRKASEVKPYSNNGYCRVTDAVTYQPTGTANTELWVRGGGWENGELLSNFASRVKNSSYIAIVLSATQPNGQYNSNYFFKYYQDRMPGANLQRVYTTARNATDPNLIQIIQNAGAIVITGGQADLLRHLKSNVGVGAAIVAAYRNGIPVYTNSASASLVGTYFGWDITKRQVGLGLGLTAPTFVSHLEAPQNYGQGLNDLWALVPNHSKQSFGLTAGTLTAVNGTTMAVYGSDPSKHFVYVYDQRLPRTENCRYWVLLPGDKFGIGL